MTTQKKVFDYKLKRVKGTWVYVSSKRTYILSKQKYGTWYIMNGKYIVASAGTLRDAVIICMKLTDVI